MKDQFKYQVDEVKLVLGKHRGLGENQSGVKISIRVRVVDTVIVRVTHFLCEDQGQL